jgi:hypothetical protein
MGSYRRYVAAASAAVALLGLPGVASAEIRQGSATDPTGDSAGAASQDIVSATAQYDSNGQVTVMATMNGDIASGPRSFFSFDVKSYAPPAQCTGSYVSMFGFSDSQYDTVMVQGVSGTGSSPITRSGNTIAFGASGSALRDRDYSCMTLTVSRGGQNESGIVDQLDVPLFFDGYGPDTDGDGVKDNQDKCPNQAGPAPGGCPPAPTPAVVTPTPAVKTCKPPVLKGKTLRAAKAALKKASCKLGNVTKPKNVKKGTTLVVTKQTGKGPVNLTFGPKKTRK